jgi:hypothetical protein
VRADWLGSIRKSDPPSPFHNLSFCESRDCSHIDVNGKSKHSSVPNFFSTAPRRSGLPIAAAVQARCVTMSASHSSWSFLASFGFVLYQQAGGQDQSPAPHPPPRPSA